MASLSAPAAEEQQLSRDLQEQQILSAIYAPYVEDMKRNYESSANLLQSSVSANMTPEQNSALAPLIQNYRNMSNNVADAYALQVQMFPSQNRMAQAAQDARAAAQSGGSSTALDLNSLAAQASQ